MKNQPTKGHPVADPGSPAKPARQVTKSKSKTKTIQASAAQGGGDGRDERIRQSAYALYQARNYTHGHELEDWLQAEAQIDKLLGNASKPAQAYN